MNQNLNEDNQNNLYHPEQLAQHLILNDKNIESLSSQLFDLDYDNKKKDKYDDYTFKFELLINLAMEVLFKYIEYHSLSEILDDKGNIDYNSSCNNYEVNDFSIEEIEKIMKDRLVKLSIFTSIHPIDDINYYQNYYCKTIFKNTCNDHQKSYFFNNDKKFHFLLNSNFDKTKLNNLKDVFTIFDFKDKKFILKFDYVNKM